MEKPNLSNRINIYSFILAFCSLIYELLIAQTLTLFAANTAVCYSLTVGFYLGGMGVGAFFWKRIFSETSPSRTLFRIEAGLSLLGGVSVIVIYIAHMLSGYLWLRFFHSGAVIIFFSSVLFLILAVGFLTGMEVPVLITLSKQNGGEQKNVYRILGADYFGCLVGGVGFPLILLPRLGLLRTAFLAALINCLVAFHIFYCDGKKGGIKMKALLLPGLTALLVISGIMRHQSLEQYFLKKYYYYKDSAANLIKLFWPSSEAPEIERARSLYHNIDLVKIKSYHDPFTDLLIPAYSRKRLRPTELVTDRYVLYLNGDFQFLTDFEEIYHEYFAHVPVILNKRVPRRVLVLGGGDGILVRELLKYKELKSIDLVDIDRKMIDLATAHPIISAVNNQALADPRVSVRVGDAYQFIRSEAGVYDAIYIDFPDPKDFDLSKLYSVEFYNAVQKKLSEDGFAVMDAPGLGAYPRGTQKKFINSRQHRMWRVFLATVKTAGFDTVMPYVSNLEADNKKAENFLRQSLKDVSRLSVFESDIEGRKEMTRIYDKEEMIGKVIEGYVNDQRKAFIFLKKGNVAPTVSYREQGLKLYVLNKERFSLAFDVPYADEAIDDGLINSIMRPTLPEGAFWWRIRMPN